MKQNISIIGGFGKTVAGYQKTIQSGHNFRVVCNSNYNTLMVS